jgi:peptidoglycan/LPS O-acetylase OafA/YrhL
VAAVVAYHLDDRLLPGGFVGVDVFFVLSGYLITTLLLVEHRRSGGRVDLRGFWARRVRRLWPLAWLVLCAVALGGLAGAWTPDRERTLPVETVAALANVYNWWQVRNGGYVAEFVAPSPLRHFWSLAIEEQFYLVWPVVLVGMLALVRRWGPRAMWAVLGLLAAASVLNAAVVTPEQAYLGTLSRAVALVAGAALAWGFRRSPMRAPVSPGWRRGLALWGAAGAAVVVVVLFRATPESPVLHRGGFAVVAVAGAGVVAVALGPGPVRRLLATPWLVWLGRRSYAVYLVHWPLIVALGPERSLASRVALVVPSSLLAAEVLGRLVEGPVIARRVRPRVLALSGVVVLAVTAAALRAGVPVEPTAVERAAATLEPVRDPEVGAAPAGSGVAADDGATAPPTTQPCVPAPPAPVPQFGDESTFDAATVTGVADPTGACEDQARLLVVGDSLGRGVSNGLVSLGDPRLLLWDRTTLGCSLGPERCGDWREAWSVNVLGIRPDVVLFYANVVTDLAGVDDAPFMSPEGQAQREAVLTEAVRVLGGTGARVLLAAPAAPGRPNGLYYCRGRAVASACDPTWVQAWGDSLRRVAAATGAGIIDAAGWVNARGDTAASDRPDGLHLSGRALREHASWLLPQVVEAARSGSAGPAG